MNTNAPNNSKERVQRDARRVLEQNLGIPFSDGNTLEIKQNGDEIFPPMLDAIANARGRIDFATYVYWQGNIAERFAAALENRARDGLRVRVLLDSVGAKLMPQELVDKMIDAGVDLRWFRPLLTFEIARNDNRTHRKLLICDDTVGFTGGVGIAQEWEGNARNSAEWRDTQVMIKGPAVDGLRAAFLDNWNEAGPWSFEAIVSDQVQHPDGIPIQVVRSSTTVSWTTMATLIRTLVSLSERRLRLVTAYFSPDDTLVNVLVDAAGRGVDVELMVPGKHCDSRLSQLAGYQKMQELLDAGVRIWHYDKTMLHSKLLTVDDYIACIGSANLNHRSMIKDEECCVVALSQEIVARLDQQFETDLAYADDYDAQRWRERSLLQRAQERIARLIVGQV